MVYVHHWCLASVVAMDAEWVFAVGVLCLVPLAVSIPCAGVAEPAGIGLVGGLFVRNRPCSFDLGLAGWAVVGGGCASATGCCTYAGYGHGLVPVS